MSIMNYLGQTSAFYELSSSMFDQYEPPRSRRLLSSDETTPCIDISKTFSPRPYYVTIPAKLFLVTWVVALMAYSIKSFTFSSFWLAYLTNWGWTVTVAYFVSSLGVALCLIKRGDGPVVRLFVNVTWGLLVIALPAEIVISGLYWFLTFKGSLYYIQIMLHGGGALLLVIDGFVINRIPLRIKQFVLFEGFSIVYLVWSLIFTYSDMTNPYQEAGYQDDDALYSTLRWKVNTTDVVVLSTILLIVVNPIVFYLCRGMSRMLPRRMVVAEEEENGGIESG